MSQGLVILDNNCFAALLDARALATLRANLRAADLTPRISEVNLLEAASAGPGARARLVEVLQALRGANALLEWPFSLLKQSGQRMLAGEKAMFTGMTGKEWYLDDPAALNKLQGDCLAFMQGIERDFSALLIRTRPRIQQALKQVQLKPSIHDVRTFLDEVWWKTEMARTYAEVTWPALGLSGNAPFEAISRSPLWRLLLDAEGFALFARAIAWEQPKKVERADLIQLIYLGAGGRRILATGDGRFLTAARAIITGRYSGARVMHIAELTT